MENNPKRTEGDGMENDNTDITKNVKEESTSHFKKWVSMRDKFIYSHEEFKTSSLKPPVITGEMIQLKPSPIIIKTPKNENQLRSLHLKEPKFVPYEPYKGAVMPLVPLDNVTKHKKIKKKSNSSITETKPKGMDTKEERVHSCSSGQTDQCEQTSCDRLQNELERIQKENQQLKNQLKFQIQVNGDLKNLLVASVGEDMETRVQFLTEDKLHLAQALLNSAQKLNTHQEQTEWLAGQCEVWRSKFLASSIMVEELAKWKALLTRRVQDLHDSTKLLLDERLKVREYLISVYKDLNILCDNFDVTSLRSGIHKLSSSSVLDLSEVDMQLSAVVRLQLLGNSLVPPTSKDPSLLQPTFTEVETAALELINHPVPELENADAAYSAVMGAAFAVNANHNPFSPACCGHCSGEIKTV